MSLFDNEIVEIVKSNMFPPPVTYVEKFKTFTKGEFPEIAIVRDHFKPKNDSPSTLKELGLICKEPLTIDDMLAVMIQDKYDNNTNRTSSVGGGFNSMTEEEKIDQTVIS